MNWLIVLVLLAIAYHFWKKHQQPGARLSSIDDALDSDNWDTPSDLVPSNPRPIQATLRLSYRDASGSATERHVTVRECDTTNPAGYLIGHCQLRDSIRTFRMDRIKRAIDVETGEVITSLTDYAAKKYAESPVAALDSLLADSADALRALFYIGKADGRFTAKEKQVFLAYCQQASGDERITLKQIEKACRDIPVPTMQAFKLICGRLGKLEPARRAGILQAAEEMIATEKTIAAEEAEAMAYMKKRLDESTG